ncbi:major histocompatibility complex class I-related gene protein-like [Podarcis muralis]
MHGWFTAVWEPSRGLFEFTAEVYVDDQRATYYDRQSRQAVPGVPWMKDAVNHDPHIWNINTWRLQNAELRFRKDVENLQKHYNQSGGFHTWQMAYGCEVSEDGHRAGYTQYGYDGEDFLSFDKETLTWTATDVPAQFTKRKWEIDLAWSQHIKFYLEKECPEWLPKFLECGKEVLLRKEPPTVKVTRMAGYDGLETLICQAYGFYPREINAKWMKDGEVWEQDTFRRDVVPNSDGTYYAWLGIKVDPKDRDHFRCHVEHDGLPEPLDLAWEEPASKVFYLWIILVPGAVLMVLMETGERVAPEQLQQDILLVCQRAEEGAPKPVVNLQCFSRAFACKLYKLHKGTGS